MPDSVSNPDSLPHVVVIGGGFAGLYATRTLRKAPVQITLLDRENYHLFQPLLYQVAMAELNPSDIAFPLRATFRRQKNTTVLLGQAEAIHLPERRITLSNGELNFDYLLVATGAHHSYFGHNEWAPNAPGLKTISDALEIRRRVFLAFEAAERELDDAKRAAWLTFVVVGGGPTGVELAGALAEISNRTLRRDFRYFDPRHVKVILVEGMDRILQTYQPDLSAKAADQLRNLGVTVQTSSFVSSVDDSRVRIGDTLIATKTVLWAAGVEASPLARSLNTELDKAGRVVVNSDLSIPAFEFAFVAGDLATVQSEEKPVPGVAPAAIQAGICAAKNIERLSQGRRTEPFLYKDKGSLATIGRAAAVAEFKYVRFSGFFAWLSWLMIHIFFLIGFRNRLWVLSGWAWSYLTFQRGARLITGRHRFGLLPPVSTREPIKDRPE